VSKNTITAFILIIGVVYLFQSPFFYKYILHTQSPFQTPPTAATQKNDSPTSLQKASGEASKIELQEKTVGPLEGRAQKEGGNNVSVPAPSDTVKKDTVWVETDKLICGISENGGRIISLKTKEYFYNRTRRDATVNLDSIIELIPEATSLGGANLTISSTCYDSSYFKHEGTEHHIRLSAKDTATARFCYLGTGGESITKTFTFSSGTYRIGLNIESPSLAGKSVVVGWNCGLRESEEPTGGQIDQYSRMKVHVNNGTDVDHLQMKKAGQKEERTGKFNWIGVTSKYFLIALIPTVAEDVDVSIQSIEDQRLMKKKNPDVNYRFQLKRTIDSNRDEFIIYAGPTQIQELRKQKVGLEKALFGVMWGGWHYFFRADLWFPVICEYLLLLLIYLENLVKDWGLAILLITVIVKVVTYPMSLSSMRSMSKMKDIQPKLTAIRNKYKANPRKMNEEIMAFYKTEGINPLNPGCLPMFLQMPLLIALFVVLQRAIELRGVPTLLVPWVKDLSMPESIYHLPFQIPMYGSNFAIIPIVMALLTFFQNRMTIKDPNQKFMIWFMPIFMFVLFNNFPAGLVIYWTLSSALGLVQQKLVDRSIAAKAPAAVPVETRKGNRHKK
jgi:YidC/Oxa1 family membrane protein insertase